MKIQAWRRAWRGFRERWLTWRNRRIADPAFQRYAARSKWLCFFARRDTAALFDLCAGFVYSQILFACVELDVFNRLAEQPRTAAELGACTGLDTQAADRLLTAAASLDLVADFGDGRFGLGRLGAAVIGNPAVAAMIAHHDRLYRDLVDPVASLRGRPSSRALADYWGYAGQRCPAGLTNGQTADYTALMGRSQTMIADQVLAGCDLSTHRRLLDIGGGDGSFAIAALRAHPRLCGRILDLPGVAEHARAQIAAAGLTQRLTFESGDFFNDAWPSGVDLVTLVRVLHDHDDDGALALLRTARRTLSPGGRLLIVEPMADGRDARRIGHAYFGFYLWAMGQGRVRSAKQLGAMLETAGFDQWRRRTTPIPILASILEASV